jgi:hypothetical protein
MNYIKQHNQNKLMIQEPQLKYITKIDSSIIFSINDFQLLTNWIGN